VNLHFLHFQEEIFLTFQSIKFKPEHFKDFLLKEVGYASVELLGVPTHNSKGFQRPVFLFKKGSSSPTATVITVPEPESEPATSSTEEPTENRNGTKGGPESEVVPPNPNEAQGPIPTTKWTSELS
jgi:7SK snRNA methylphosphate capping enzyme